MNIPPPNLNVIEPDDLVFMLDKKGGSQHRGRARVVSVDGSTLTVLPLPRHRQTMTVDASRVRLWKSEKVDRWKRHLRHEAERSQARTTPSRPRTAREKKRAKNMKKKKGRG